MKRIKINLDRPPVDSKSIQAHKDFNGLMKNHAIMSKPFYKTSWFMGSAGIATVGLVVVCSVGVKSTGNEVVEDFAVTIKSSSVKLVPEISDNALSLIFHAYYSRNVSARYQ